MREKPARSIRANSFSVPMASYRDRLTSEVTLLMMRSSSLRKKPQVVVVAFDVGERQGCVGERIRRVCCVTFRLETAAAQESHDPSPDGCCGARQCPESDTGMLCATVSDRRSQEDVHRCRLRRAKVRHRMSSRKRLKVPNSLTQQ